MGAGSVGAPPPVGGRPFWPGRVIVWVDPWRNEVRTVVKGGSPLLLPDDVAKRLVIATHWMEPVGTDPYYHDEVYELTDEEFDAVVNGA